MQIIRICVFLLCFFSFTSIIAQDSTSFEISGYAEVYGGIQQGSSSQRPEFFYNYTSNRPALNLGWLRYTIRHNRWQLVAAPMA
ncbi:MAG: hypothetical protein ACKOSR_02400, partial [Flavobacteriales bacterium]